MSLDPITKISILIGLLILVIASELVPRTWRLGRLLDAFKAECDEEEAEIAPGPVDRD